MYNSTSYIINYFGHVTGSTTDNSLSCAMRGYLAVSPPCCCSTSSPVQHTAMPMINAGRLCGGLRRGLLSQLGAVERQSMQDMTRGSIRHMAIRAATKTEAPADANTSAKVRAGHDVGVDVPTVASCLEGPAHSVGLVPHARRQEAGRTTSFVLLQDANITIDASNIDACATW